MVSCLEIWAGGHYWQIWSTFLVIRLIFSVTPTSLWSSKKESQTSRRAQCDRKCQCFNGNSATTTGSLITIALWWRRCAIACYSRRHSRKLRYRQISHIGYPVYQQCDVDISILDLLIFIIWNCAGWRVRVWVICVQYSGSHPSYSPYSILLQDKWATFICVNEPQPRLRKWKPEFSKDTL